jgi:hypothetical protein
MELKSAQLLSAKRLLRHAHSLIEDVADLFHKRGDADSTTRLKAITGFISDEILELDHKIALLDRAEETQP